MNPSEIANDLTTTKAAFIEKARDRGDLFIHQPYELYSEANQETWGKLYAAMEPLWHKYANEQFIDGLDRLALDPQTIPVLEDVNRFLEPLSGFKSRAVSGYVPTYLFFDCLRRREFPTTITIRSGSTLEYLPEPDIFHDLAGHVPMHTHRVFADILVRFGEVARTAATTARAIDDPQKRIKGLESVIRAMARFFWFTIEFGLMRGPRGEICVYGSGLLSSSQEIQHAVESPEVGRYPFQLEWVVHQHFEIDHFQPLLFVIDSFEHLFAQVDELERWVLEGKLNNVSPGEPMINEADLQSFLEAGSES